MADIWMLIGGSRPTPAGGERPLCGTSPAIAALRVLPVIPTLTRPYLGITQRECSGLSKRIVMARHMITDELSGKAYVCITNFISSNSESLAFQHVCERESARECLHS